ncbi:hypothetical protein [Azospirillum sp. A39]|uniref:hypothetical protein n=1 Tax=Azospirillum sp. A39 TaxID=3462279 RepID=UPI004045EF8E
MPQDFRSMREAAQAIGFHELRQACEISTLRQDLERAHRRADALRSLIDATVDRVRERVAALTADDLADAATMAPLLQDAVAQLIAIRDAARRGAPEPDGGLPAPAPARRDETSVGETPAVAASMSNPATSTEPPPATPPATPSAGPAAAPAAMPSPASRSPAGSWLLPAADPTVRGGPPRPAGGAPAAVDWLRPARR